MEFKESTKEEPAPIVPPSLTNEHSNSGSYQEPLKEVPNITYSRRQFPDLRPEDVNEFGASTDAAIHPRDDKKLGEISTLLKDYDDQGRCQYTSDNVHGTIVLIKVESLDLETIIKLQHSPDVLLAYYPKVYYRRTGPTIRKIRPIQAMKRMEEEMWERERERARNGFYHH